MIDCIQPVLTKCNQSEDNLDIDQIKADLVKQFMEEFQSADGKPVDS
jgi:hypothetical protein